MKLFKLRRNPTTHNFFVDDIALSCWFSECVQKENFVYELQITFQRRPYKCCWLPIWWYRTYLDEFYYQRIKTQNQQLDKGKWNFLLASTICRILCSDIMSYGNLGSEKFFVTRNILFDCTKLPENLSQIAKAGTWQ